MLLCDPRNLHSLNKCFPRGRLATLALHPFGETGLYCCLLVLGIAPEACFDCGCLKPHPLKNCPPLACSSSAHMYSEEDVPPKSIPESMLAAFLVPQIATSSEILAVSYPPRPIGTPPLKSPLRLWPMQVFFCLKLMLHGRQDSRGLQRGMYLLYSSSGGSGLHVAVDVACSLLACLESN